MDSLFGVGSTELILIIVIATILLGPRQMVKVAREMGRLVRNMRNYSDDFFRTLNQELSESEAGRILENTAPGQPQAIQPEAIQPKVVQPDQEPDRPDGGTGNADPGQG